MHLTPDEYQDLMARQRAGSRGADSEPKKKSKYGNEICEADGHTFHSRKERDFYFGLCCRKRSGDVCGFDLQPKFYFPSEEQFKKLRITYTADFRIYNTDGTETIVDVKSPATRRKESYRIKVKLLLYFYPQIHFIEA